MHNFSAVARRLLFWCFLPVHIIFSDLPRLCDCVATARPQLEQGMNYNLSAACAALFSGNKHNPRHWCLLGLRKSSTFTLFGALVVRPADEVSAWSQRARGVAALTCGADCRAIPQQLRAHWVWCARLVAPAITLYTGRKSGPRNTIISN